MVCSREVKSSASWEIKLGSSPVINLFIWSDNLHLTTPDHRYYLIATWISWAVSRVVPSLQRVSLFLIMSYFSYAASLTKIIYMRPAFLYHDRASIPSLEGTKILIIIRLLREIAIISHSHWTWHTTQKNILHSDGRFGWSNATLRRSRLSVWYNWQFDAGKGPSSEKNGMERELVMKLGSLSSSTTYQIPLTCWQIVLWWYNCPPHHSNDWYPSDGF